MDNVSKAREFELKSLAEEDVEVAVKTEAETMTGEMIDATMTEEMIDEMTEEMIEETTAAIMTDGTHETAAIPSATTVARRDIGLAIVVTSQMLVALVCATAVARRVIYLATARSPARNPAEVVLALAPPPPPLQLAETEAEAEAEVLRPATKPT
eukprot:GILJ01002588.1.p2 GENE.GILJ01002588.1~~GILJ01002588.1.p2  ORF type:complete len:155 (+),score=19.21 GILJ01002588.1:230-694(+)